MTDHRAEAECLLNTEAAEQREHIEAERDSLRQTARIAMWRERAERAGAERDEWKAKHAALRAAVQVMLAHAEPDSWEDLRLRRILDRDTERGAR